MIETAVALVFGGAILGIVVVKRRARLKGWEEAARSCGLQIVEAPGGLSPTLRARAGPVSVQIRTWGDKGRYTRILVQAPAAPDFQGVKIRPETMFKFGRESEVGDRVFDDAFFLEGPAQPILALLDEETRKLLTELNGMSKFSIASGELTATFYRDERITDILRHLLALGERLVPPFDIAQRLAENANQDPIPGVRLQNLLLLIRERVHDPETAGALRKACSDPFPEIRLRAAKQLGDKGVLLDLAEKLEDDAVSAESLSILDLSSERVDTILDLALKQGRLRSARVCLAALGRHGAIEKLAQVLESHPELAPAAAEALGATGSPAAEPPLIQALQREEVEVQVAAANALGKVGSPAAVLPLKEAAERSRLDLDLRRATRQAIAEIQSRIRGASPGQLTLAGTETGQLSLAHDPAGQLSFDDETD